MGVFLFNLKRFLKPIANGLFYEKNNQEAFVLLNLMLYDFKYVSVRHYEKLCKIFRRTKNYPYELLIIKRRGVCYESMSTL